MGSVLLCQHGNRRIVRIAPDMKMTTLVDRYQGKKLNAPNDLVYRSRRHAVLHRSAVRPSEARRRSDEGAAVQRRVQAEPAERSTLIIDDLTRPNGIAFSPDEKTLYVSNSDDKRRIWMRYDVAADGTVRNGRVFFDATAGKDGGLPDGMKIDVLRQHLGDRARARCSCFRRTARIWARSSRRKIPPTADGATMAGRCTSRRRRVCTDSGRR